MSIDFAAVVREAGSNAFQTIFRYHHQTNRSGMISCLIPQNHKRGDKNPSMKVYKDHAYCFVCHHSVDVLDLLEIDEGMTKVDACIYLQENGFIDNEEVKEAADKKFGRKREDKKRVYMPINYKELELIGLENPKKQIEVTVGFTRKNNAELPHDRYLSGRYEGELTGSADDDIQYEICKSVKPPTMKDLYTENPKLALMMMYNKSVEAEEEYRDTYLYCYYTDSTFYKKYLCGMTAEEQYAYRTKVYDALTQTRNVREKLLKAMKKRGYISVSPDMDIDEKSPLPYV